MNSFSAAADAAIADLQ